MVVMGCILDSHKPKITASRPREGPERPGTRTVWCAPWICRTPLPPSQTAQAPPWAASCMRCVLPSPRDPPSGSRSPPHVPRESALRTQLSVANAETRKMSMHNDP